MKSVAKIFPLGSVLPRRQLHLGWEFTLLAKDSRGESKPFPAEVGAQEDKKREPKAKANSTTKPRYSLRKHCVTKVSAAVRASHLSKDDTKTTVQVPEELRDPSVAMAACASGPKRSELDQRKVRRNECATQLEELITHKKANSQVTVRRMPFVRMSVAQEPDPVKLAKAFITLRNDLLAERTKSEAITQSYLELRAEMYARNNKRKAAKRAKAGTETEAEAEAKAKTK